MEIVLTNEELGALKPLMDRLHKDGFIHVIFATNGSVSSGVSELMVVDEASVTILRRKSMLYTYSEARKVLGLAGIRCIKDYNRYFVRDPRLPRIPRDEYPDDWRGWHVFLAASYYSYAEARVVVQRMGIKSMNRYMEKYKADPRLPPKPALVYRSEWRGSKEFFKLESSTTNRS